MAVTYASEKWKKVDESYTINKYDNGYMIEVSGRDENDDWATTKIIALSFDEVIEIIEDVDTLPRT